MKIPVKGTNFVKDTSSGALLTVNRGVLLENETIFFNVLLFSP